MENNLLKLNQEAPEGLIEKIQEIKEMVKSITPEEQKKIIGTLQPLQTPEGNALSSAEKLLTMSIIGKEQNNGD